MIALKEVANVLLDVGDHTPLLCRVECDASGYDLVVTLRISPNGGMAALSLQHALEYLADVASLRMLATRYGIDPADLEGLLAKARKEEA